MPRRSGRRDKHIHTHLRAGRLGAFYSSYRPFPLLARSGTGFRGVLDFDGDVSGVLGPRVRPVRVVRRVEQPLHRPRGPRRRNTENITGNNSHRTTRRCKPVSARARLLFGYWSFLFADDEQRIASVRQSPEMSYQQHSQRISGYGERITERPYLVQTRAVPLLRPLLTCGDLRDTLGDRIRQHWWTAFIICFASRANDMMFDQGLTLRRGVGLSYAFVFISNRRYNSKRSKIIRLR